MNRFAELLDRLAYEPGRNNKLRLITDYLRTTPDPERGYALAALTGALSFQHAKPGVIRALIAERTDPVLFELSYDYVGDLSETVALMWPAPQTRRSQPAAAVTDRTTPSLSVDDPTLSTLGKAQLAGADCALARCARRDRALGAAQARHRRAAHRRLGAAWPRPRRRRSATRTPNEIEMLWPGLTPPYVELFAWLEGRAEKPVSRDAAPFRPADAGARARRRRASPPSIRPTSWPSGNGTASACRRSPARTTTAIAIARLYSRTGEDISESFPDLIEALRLQRRASTANC